MLAGAEEKFLVYLKKRELKFTPERQAILQEVFSIHKHFDIEELFEKLRKRGEHLSRATIYRTLPLMVESGLIRETLRCRETVNYEHTFGHPHHDHLLCVKCGKVIEFKEEKIEKLQKAVCRKYNFTPVEHKLGIRGYCEKCKRGTVRGEGKGIEFMTNKSLKELKPGEKGRITKVSGAGSVRRRIMDMGVVAGAEVVLERKAPLGDPVEVKIRGYHLSLRKEEAANIFVETNA